MKKKPNQTDAGAKMNLLELFCDVDDFCLRFEPTWDSFLISSKFRSRQRKRKMSLSEMMTILIHFHQERHRDFKTFYLNYVERYLSSHFPNLYSYQRFIHLMPETLLPLVGYSHLKKGKCTGISFIDSTALRVCHNKRIPRHKTFKKVAARGKSSMGWFFGFKLHLVSNEKGELLDYRFTPGNHDDRSVFPDLVREVFGKLYGDKGYISKDWTEKLQELGVSLIYPIRSNMKPKMMSLFDRLMLRKRVIVESVIDQLKNVSQLEHSRHRGLGQFMAHGISALIAYLVKPTKPSLNLREEEYSLLPVVC
jgi:hypothetical protein